MTRYLPRCLSHVGRQENPSSHPLSDLLKVILGSLVGTLPSFSASVGDLVAWACWEEQEVLKSS